MKRTDCNASCCGDDDVAELDFVDALVETVRNESVFADEIVFEFVGHGIQLPIGKFEKTARLFLFGFPIGQDGTDGGEGSGRSGFGNGVLLSRSSSRDPSAEPYNP